jgi:hypothetical protein
VADCRKEEVKRLTIGTVGLALLAGALPAQDLLPPGVLLLSRLKRHVRQELSHLPQYTCLETIQRFRKPAGPKGEMKPTDTMRLEILYTGDRELYASPGDVRFSEGGPLAFTGTGLIGDGVFASHVQNLLVNDNGIFTYRGEENLEGRRAVRYDVRVPVMLSGYQVSIAGGSGIVGIKGALWAEPATLDLLRLEIHADQIPSELPIDDVITTVDYARVRIGPNEVMLPQSGELHLMETSGEEARDIIEFTHCRSFQAESTIAFDAPPSGIVSLRGSGPAAGPANVEVVLPAGLPVTVALTTPVTDKAAVGELLEGRVTGDVALKGKVLMANGSVVKGRIRRLERYSDAGKYFVVGIEFTEVQTPDSLFRFYADLQNVDALPDVQWVISSVGTRMRDLPRETRSYTTTTETISVPNLPGVGCFFVRGTRFNLPAGFKTIWRTRALTPSK